MHSGSFVRGHRHEDEHEDKSKLARILQSKIEECKMIVPIGVSTLLTLARKHDLMVHN